MKLRVPICLHFEETINVRLKYNDFDVWFEGVASVRHIRADGDHSWVVGCAVEPEVRDEIIAKLASSSGKERRAYPRFEVEGAGTIQRQGDTKKGLATLRNVSEGGFCVDEENQHEPGDVVKLEIEDKNLRLCTIGACVRWQTESENGFVTGFSFNETDGFENLMACVSRKTEHKPKGTSDKLNRFVVLAALLTMILPPAFSILVQSNVSATQSEKTPLVNSENMPTEHAVVAITEPEIKIPAKENSDGAESPTPPRITAPVVKQTPQPETSTADSGNPVSTTEPPTDTIEPATAPEIPEPLSPMREWVDNTGQFRILAELQEVGDDFIKIRKSDGSVKTVSMDRLSPTDLRYLLSIKAK